MELINRTPFQTASTVGFLSDEEALVTAAVKVTSVLDHDSVRSLPTKDSWPVFEKPSEVRDVEFPPELHFGRRYVDLFVMGEACAPGGEPTRRMRVEVSSGELHYRLDVIGDRRWTRKANGVLTPTDPVPFTTLPLTNDRAFGGCVEIDDLEVPYPPNPEGRGYYDSDEAAEDAPLPNLERPDQRITDWSQRPTPACLVPPPGSSLGHEDRFELNDQGVPIAPTDRFFQTAVPDLVASRNSLGESLVLRGFSANGDLEFPLPSVGDVPRLNVRVGNHSSTVPLHLRNIVVIADERLFVVTFVGSFRYLFRPEDKCEAEIVGGDSWLTTVAPDAETTSPASTTSPKTVDTTGTLGSGTAAEDRSSVVDRKSSADVRPEDEHADSASPDEVEAGPDSNEENPLTAVFAARPGGTPELFACTRRTYVLRPDGTVIVDPEQLPLPTEYERYEPDEAEDENGRIPACKAVPEGVFKTGTDVVLKGYAHTYGQQVRQTKVALGVGRYRHVARVWGRRICEVREGDIHFSDPLPFNKVALRYENAYGGRATEAELAFGDAFPEELKAKAMPFLPESIDDFSPFLYPRNPSGLGFVVGEDPQLANGRELPRLEDPSDLLTPERILCPDVEAWPAQPLPIGFDFLDLFAFPRIAMLGLCPRYIPEDLEFRERTRQLVPEDFNRPHPLEAAPGEADGIIHNEASRSASLGLRFSHLQRDVVLTLENIHPRRPRFEFQLPNEQPEIQLRVKGEWRPVQPRIYTVLIEPEDDRLSLVWGGGIPLDRELIPNELEDVESSIDWSPTRG